jgi:hypothetical protein
MGLEHGRELVCRRLMSLLERDVDRLLRTGWGAEEIPRAVRRLGGPPAAGIIATMVGHVVCRQRGSAGHDPAVASAGRRATARDLDHSSPSWAADLVAAVDAFAVTEHLRELPDLGQFASTMSSARTPEEARLLLRIRGLLSKAESSSYPEEADAFMAKAQQLMTRHCVDRAMLDAGVCGSSEAPVEGRRLWLEDPYLAAKALLLATVADANRCRAIVTTDLGFSTIVGHRVDLDATELLFTSLLVQSTRWVAAGIGGTRGTSTRKPSYRRSFLVAFATRIGQRLRDANDMAVTAADAAMDHRLLPVLATREDRVDEVVDQLFGAGRDHLRIPLTDLVGWAAGTAAADIADLALHTALSSQAGT